MKKALTFFCVTFLLICLTNLGYASQILPDSYTVDKTTDTGSYTYHDETGVQLIDGEYGTAHWSADLGNGNAYEWLGWVHDTPVNIDFDFGASTFIDTIRVGTVQDRLDDVVIPSIEIFSYDGTDWNSEAYLNNAPESISNNNQYFTFSFADLGINSQFVRVALTHAEDGPWTFVDEVDFYNAPVPEPATMLLFGIGLLGLAGVNRRKQ